MEDKTAGNVAAENASPITTPKRKPRKSAKGWSQRPKSNHPPTSEMVTAAIKELKDRKGSSLQAIKKYISNTYTVDGEKLAPFIKKYLKAAVRSGAVVQTSGKGASGSFKLSPPSKGSSEVKNRPKREAKEKTESAAAEKPVAKKPATQKKAASPKKPAAKKPAAAQAEKPKKAKTAVAKKTEAAAKQKTAAQTKNLSKTKKATKAPAAKTKTPKPKTAKSPKAAKASPKK